MWAPTKRLGCESSSLLSWKLNRARREPGRYPVRAQLGMVCESPGFRRFAIAAIRTSTVPGAGSAGGAQPSEEREDDHAKAGLELQKPVGMERGMRFAVREGSKTVGAGVILSVE